MLGSFMEELQITPEQFEVACLEGRNTGSVSEVSEASKGEDGGTFSFHQGLFQQIWAANDIRIFIKMMVQRNLEIQLQALDLIERRQASISQSKDERSPIEAENVPNEGLYNDGEIPDEIKLPEESEVVLSTMKMLEENLNKNSSLTTEQADHILGAKLQDNVKEYDINEKYKRLNLFFENDKIDTQEVKQRQEYLRSQRDKILLIKKQVRARQLNDTVKQTGRPQSASVTAAKILIEEGTKDDLITDANSESSAQLRITLAKRLRAEVIDSTSTT